MSTTPETNTTTDTNTALAPITGNLELPKGIVLTATGILLPAGLPQTDWESAFIKMANANKVFGIAMADLIVFGEDNYSASLKALLEKTGIEPETIRRHCWIARKIEPARRRTDVLSLTHHEAVAALEPSKQDMYLSLAFSEKLSAAALRSRIEQDGAKSRRPKFVDATPINGVDLKTGLEATAGHDEDKLDERIARTLAATKRVEKDARTQADFRMQAPPTTPLPPTTSTEPVAAREAAAILAPREIDLLAPITWSATLGIRTATMTEQIGAGGRLEYAITLDGVRQTPDPSNWVQARSRAEALLRQQ